MGEGEYLTGTSKKGRQRKKQLYNRILQQMEFYFGDSNLSKDRFLSQLLNEDPYVDLKVFLDFNQIKKLNCTIDDIRKALGKSKLIELSEDKEKICRKKPLVLKKNVEEYTIYVENIKVDADHEWLIQLFSDFGKVDYVSIPKYMNNKGNKGFAFIEFEKKIDAQNALSFFDSIGCKMPSDANPDDLRSIQTFERKDNSESVENKQTKFDVEQEPDDENEKTVMMLLKKENYQRRLMNTPAKKIKKERNTDGTVEKVQEPIENQASILETEDTAKIKEECIEGEDIETKKKIKKQKEKKKTYIKELGLQVLSKYEWKKMRNRYLDLQRKKMKEFKQYLNRQKYSKSHDRPMKEEGGQFLEEPSPEVEEVVKLEYVSGVIVRIKLPEMCADPKKLKNEIKSLSPDVKYVDIPLPSGSEEVFVRFSSPENAKDFLGQDFPGEKAILQNDEERMYWEKIHNDRSVKFAKSSRKQRGKDKLLKKAEKMAKHIKFDERE
ncbi:hypothetical protein JTB14_000409 [Gonioctena quinquepunctata]|nr:hypothetical protein JTB14_000409 [Gonioctena quinquepunctata]